MNPKYHHLATSVLCQTRYTDIPSEIAQRLLGYNMYLLREAAFDLITLHAPRKKWIDSPKIQCQSLTWQVTEDNAAAL